MVEATSMEKEEKSEARVEEDQGEDAIEYEAKNKVYKFQGLAQTKEKRQVATCSFQIKLSLFVLEY